MKNIKLISHRRLIGDKYKYEFTFIVNSKIVVRKFGASGYSDYTIHKDIKRRNRYIKRHLKDLNTNDPTKPGYLSMYILWNFQTYNKSLLDYKRRLNIFNKTGIFPLNINKYPKLDNLVSFGFIASAIKFVAPTVIQAGKFIAKEAAKEAKKVTIEIAKQQVDKLNQKKKCKEGDKDCVEFGKIPTDVINKKLYLIVKNKLKNKIKERRWGVYDSVRLIKEYKKLGGKYSKINKIFGTDRWFKEKWIDACGWVDGKIINCGRTNSNQKIKYCRPLYRITDKTPKTVNELGKQKIIQLCNKKLKNPTSRIFA